MTSLKTSLLFISGVAVIWGIRWLSLSSPLPATWTPETQIRFTARILEEPEHTETKTIIRRGIWQITLRGYTDIEAGETVSVVGKVVPTLLMGKIRQIEMVEPTIIEIKNGQGQPLKGWERLVLWINYGRKLMVKVLERGLPEPEAALSAGILLGVKANMPYEFYQALVKTGTMHVIAASGYNVSVVGAAIINPLLPIVGRSWATGLGIIGIVLYVILAGGSASVVRAGIMGSLTLLAYVWGRRTEAKRLLWVTAALMIIVDPLMVGDVGFELSVAATAGLLYLQPWMVKHWLVKRSKVSNLQVYLANYLFPTLAATVSTLPIIAWHFGRISYLSPIVNMLILPVVPLTMLLSALALAIAWVPILDKMGLWLLYVPLWWVVTVIRVFGN